MRLSREQPSGSSSVLFSSPEDLPKELLDAVDAFVTKGHIPYILLDELRRLTGGARKPPARDIVAQTATYLKKKQSLHE